MSLKESHRVHCLSEGESAAINRVVGVSYAVQALGREAEGIVVVSPINLLLDLPPPGSPGCEEASLLSVPDVHIEIVSCLVSPIQCRVGLEVGELLGCRPLCPQLG